MNYFIRRNDQEYGPYTLADVQRYVASGNILLTDVARSEGMADWVPVSQVVGNIPMPITSAPAGAGGAAAVERGPEPPNLHWALVLLLAIVTCGLFGMVWVIVQAVWLKKIRPDGKPLKLLLGYLGLVGIVWISSFVMGMAGAATGSETESPAFAGLMFICYIGMLVCFIWGVFSMRSQLEDYYSNEVPIGLSLSGIMTFFFNYIYFQYHFNRIAEWRRTGVLRH